MRQRNAGAHPLIVMDDPPREVAPGEVIDFDGPLAGFEPVEDDEGAGQASDEAKPAKGRKGSKAAASAEDVEEVNK